MKTSKTKIIPIEDKRSYGIQVSKFDNGIEEDRFIIPVIDARDGDAERGIINAQVKSIKRSKFMQPSFSVIGKSYQVSQKKIINDTNI